MHERKKIKVIILGNETTTDSEGWVLACEARKSDIEYSLIDLTADFWLDKIMSQSFDILLAKPTGLSSLFKQLYDERIYILSKVLHYPIFPSAEEIFLYENKRFLSYWLKANKFPHPETHVFYRKDEALKYLTNSSYPLVAKTNLGASGSGVTFLNDKLIAQKYLFAAFSKRGASKRWGPNLIKGNLIKRGLHYLIEPRDISKKLTIYQTRKRDIQRGFIIIQEYIPHEYEWRVVRIGDSYFAHKKLKIRGKASGSLLKGYTDPPLSILDFVKNITDKFNLFSQAIDIFELCPESYLINEMQCIFGQSDPFQMLVNQKPGRYFHDDSKWIFEEGDFNSNQCFDLRLDYVIKRVLDKKI